PGLCARTNRERGVERVVPRFPELLPFFLLRRPAELAPAMLACERLNRRRLIADVRFAVTVELEEERGGNRIVGAGVAIDRLHFRVVEQFDARHRHAEL